MKVPWYRLLPLFVVAAAVGLLDGYTADFTRSAETIALVDALEAAARM